jgi:hypothetical protein
MQELGHRHGEASPAIRRRPLKDLKTKGVGPAANPARYYKLILIGHQAYEMAEQVWLHEKIFRRKAGKTSRRGIALDTEYVFMARFDGTYEDEFHRTLDGIGQNIILGCRYVSQRLSISRLRGRSFRCKHGGRCPFDCLN